ncbi:MAG TPA: hypothetical protein VLQ78_01675, partial [Ornithinibacter sp.]|nr:hypothetical protein [Ornithinibacter sp.]
RRRSSLTLVALLVAVLIPLGLNTALALVLHTWTSDIERHDVRRGGGGRHDRPPLTRPAPVDTVPTASPATAIPSTTARHPRYLPAGRLLLSSSTLQEEP